MLRRFSAPLTTLVASVAAGNNATQTTIRSKADSYRSMTNKRGLRNDEDHDDARRVAATKDSSTNSASSRSKGKSEENNKKSPSSPSRSTSASKKRNTDDKSSSTKKYQQTAEQKPRVDQKSERAASERNEGGSNIKKGKDSENQKTSSSSSSPSRRDPESYNNQFQTFSYYQQESYVGARQPDGTFREERGFLSREQQNDDEPIIQRRHERKSYDAQGRELKVEGEPAKPVIEEGAGGIESGQRKKLSDTNHEFW